MSAYESEFKAPQELTRREQLVRDLDKMRKSRPEGHWAIVDLRKAIWKVDNPKAPVAPGLNDLPSYFPENYQRKLLLKAIETAQNAKEIAMKQLSNARKALDDFDNPK